MNMPDFSLPTLYAAMQMAAQKHFDVDPATFPDGADTLANFPEGGDAILEICANHLRRKLVHECESNGAMWQLVLPTIAPDKVIETALEAARLGRRCQTRYGAEFYLALVEHLLFQSLQSEGREQ